MKKYNLKKIIFLALMTVFSLCIAVVESMLPLVFIAPGAKLGLANIMILTVLVVYGFRECIIVSILRCVLYMLLFGNPISFIYSITSGIFSASIMFIIYRYLNKYFSLIGVSVYGAIAHNFCQVMVASVMINNINMIYYLPILSLLSVFTGVFVGIVSTFLSDMLINSNIREFQQRG